VRQYLVSVSILSKGQQDALNNFDDSFWHFSCGVLQLDEHAPNQD
jgi:hypothetical protein